MPGMSVEELMYRRSREYATRVYKTFLESTYQPKPKANAATEAQIDDIQLRLMKKYPYRSLLVGL
jgi:hypothetical protein